MNFAKLLRTFFFVEHIWWLLLYKSTVVKCVYIMSSDSKNYCYYKRQPFKGVLIKRCSENMQQIYRTTPMPKCDFNKVAKNFIEIILWQGCSPANLLHIFRTTFSKNASGGLLLSHVLGSSFIKTCSLTGC